MVDFWCRFFHGLVPTFFTVYAKFSWFIRDIHGETKTSRYWWSFSRLAFHGLPPLEPTILSQGCIFFCIEMSFLCYRGGLSLLLGIEISFGVSRFWTLLFDIEIVFFLGSTRACFFGLDISCKLEVKKISIPKRRSKYLDTKKKTSRYQLKESPLSQAVLHGVPPTGWQLFR